MGAPVEASKVIKLRKSARRPTPTISYPVDTTPEFASSLEELPKTASLTCFRLSVLVPVYNERHVVEASLRRVLELQHELISSMEIIVVDDQSTDGTWTILQRLAAQDERIVLLRNEKNLGKGAALRKAIAQSTGDISIVHDADLEYNPSDIPALLLPFAREGADAVFGSRYLSSLYRRALMHRHTTINKILTSISNWLTDLDLTDLETCYKAVKTDLLKSIPIRSNDFRFEVEITFKLAKRRARVFEAPIRYVPRTREEGKKIRALDGPRALLAMVHYWLIDDLYSDEEYGSRMRSELEHTRRLTLWLAKTLRPFIGDRVLEIGAGLGTLTSQFIPRERYLASDTNPHCLGYLQSYSYGKPYLHVLKIDASNRDDFTGLESGFDTALVINALEQTVDKRSILNNLWEALEPGGKAIILIRQRLPFDRTLDEVNNHREYNPVSLTKALSETNFRVERLINFNRVLVPVCWLNGKLLRRKRFSRVELKILNMLLPILSKIDRFIPWRGLSLIAIACKE